LRSLRSPEGVEPRPGFYARVLERIEAQSARSIWSLVFDSSFGRRIAAASVALALALGFYLVTSERLQPPVSTVETVRGEDQPGLALTSAGAMDRDSILVNLVTYQEQ